MSFQQVLNFVFVSQIGLIQSWNLLYEASGSNFFNYFYFVTYNDPTHGYVNYVDYQTAVSNGYINSSSNGDVYIGCDHKNVASGRGRDSIRIESTQEFSYGLFVLYLSHMPTWCGTWPAFWTHGSNWPYEGEVDIIEGINEQTYDHTTLHTGPGCDFNSAPPRNFSGNIVGSQDCNSLINDDSGCSISSSNPNSYGYNLNAAGGGLYALQWTSSGIFSWFWNEGRIPSDALGNSPNPNSWGEPYASFPFGSYCPASNFKSQKITFDLTFCGYWAGSAFSSQCPGKGSCNDYVKYNPQAFQEAYWNIHWMKVFN